MREPFDVDKFIYFATMPGATAAYVREAMGLRYSTSYINRLIKRYVGTRPSRKDIKRPNVLREAVARYMEAQGLDRHYCANCQRRSSYECAIHPLIADATIDDLVFVCVSKCAAPGDY